MVRNDWLHCGIVSFENVSEMINVSFTVNSHAQHRNRKSLPYLAVCSKDIEPRGPVNEQRQSKVQEQFQIKKRLTSRTIFQNCHCV